MADSVLIPTVGKGLITAALLTSAYKYMGWGTGTTNPVAANTALETARAEARTTGTQSQQTTTTTNDTYQVVGTITCASTVAVITELAIFDATTVGVLFLRDVFSAINVNVGDSVQFTTKVQLT